MSHRNRAHPHALPALLLGILVPAPVAAQQAPVIPGLAARHPLDERQVGSLLVHELRCTACHAMDPGTGLAERRAPRLDGIGARVAPEYLQRFLADPAATEPGTLMPDVLGDADPAERERIAQALTAYLVAGAPIGFAREPVDPAESARGRKLYESVGCLACHAVEDAARVHGKYRPSSLAEFLYQPSLQRPSGRMPDLGLSREEARFVASYLLDRAGPATTAPPPAPELAEAGRRYFERYRCASCHERDDVPAPAADVPWSPAAADRGCLAADPGTAPDYHLDEDQRAALRRALAEAPPPLTDQDRLDFTLTAWQCLRCHERGGHGGVDPSKDEYFRTTQPDLGKEARIPPHLDGVGGKLQLEWLQKVLFDGAAVRPYLSTRMPRFPEPDLSYLPGLLERLDRTEPVTIPEPEGDARRAAQDAGVLLLGDRGLACITCHDFNGLPSPRFQGLDLIGTYDRLRPGWFLRYLDAPQEYEPGTVMPSFWSGHQSALPGVMGDDATAQMRAIWFVLSLGTSAPLPAGIRPVDTRLAVTDTPRLYRGRSRIAGFRGIAVGFPEGLHYAFNARTGALTGLWRGEFIGVRWDGQGAGDFHPIGRAVELAQDLALLPLADGSSPWPLLPTLDPEAPVDPDPLYPRRLGYRFEGYRFDPDGVPTLLYRCDDVEVEDRSVVDGSGERPVLQRTLRLTAATSRTLFLRALVGAIEAEAGHRYRTPDLELTAPDTEAVLRPGSADPAAQELLLRLPLAAGTSTVRIDYALLR